MSAYRREVAERTFGEDACERLAASDREYQDTHGYYIPTLAWLLNETRAERDRLMDAVLKNCDETNLCIVCDCHPSSGHADDCPLWYDA